MIILDTHIWIWWVDNNLGNWELGIGHWELILSLLPDLKIKQRSRLAAEKGDRAQ